MSSLDLGTLKIKIGVDNTEANKNLKETEESIGKTNENAGKSFDKLKMVGTAAMVAIAAATVKLVKDSVAAYAEYEQLVGGVETLFGDSAEKVQEYANNAYMTAGMSANKYMETVTSFSASLLQSLDGDTSAAAEVANMAITDMSDNANKMGTSMESIQNAYQGFAKQNYTMLDNLKLGYGGTKAEMERLLEDATALTGVKYDISNLDDVYNAIHAIQTDIGITGTTALEASTTISGSMNMMKGAWQNLLVAFGNSEGSIKDALDNFLNSVSTFADNLLPVVGEVLQSLVEFIILFIEEHLADILQAGIEILLSLVKGIVESLPELIPALIDAVFVIVDTLIDNLDLIIDAAIQIILALAFGLIEALPKLIEKIPEIIDKLVVAIVDNLPMIIEAGFQIIIALAGALIKAIPELLKAIPKVWESLKNGFLGLVGDMGKIGLDLIKGLGNGIVNAKDWLLGKIRSLCDNALGAIKNFFGIHSPSKKTAEMGKYLAEGLAVGLEEEEDTVLDEIDSLCGNMEDAFMPNLSANVTGGYGYGNRNLNAIASAASSTLGNAATIGRGSVVQNNYFTARETTAYEQQLEIKRLQRDLVGGLA